MSSEYFVQILEMFEILEKLGYELYYFVDEHGGVKFDIASIYLEEAEVDNSAGLEKIIELGIEENVMEYFYTIKEQLEAELEDFSE